MRASPGFGAERASKLAPVLVGPMQPATIATTANTKGIRQHLVAASRTKKTHPPEGDPLATLIDTPPVTRWQASGT